jgi:predicted molibdopterin-dependent oxidoreductase YjgC
LIRQEGGLVPADWQVALQAILSGLRAPVVGILSGRNTNEEAFLFRKLMKKISPQSSLEVFYQERELTDVEKILKSPDHSPNFRGERSMGVTSNGGFEPLLHQLVEGKFQSAYVVGEDLVSELPDGEKIKNALQRLSFLVVQDTHLSPMASLAHVVLPSTHFAEKEGTYTNRKGRVQKLNAALVQPPGTLHDWQIFSRLLSMTGEKPSLLTPSQIFQVIADEIPQYRGLSYTRIGDHGVELSGETKQL